MVDIKEIRNLIEFLMRRAMKAIAFVGLAFCCIDFATTNAFYGI